MEKIPKFNKRRASNKAVRPGKKSKINKRRAYVYSGLQSSKNSSPLVYYICTFFQEFQHSFFPTLLIYLDLLVSEVQINYPPYSFIWAYLFNWYLRVDDLRSKQLDQLNQPYKIIDSQTFQKNILLYIDSRVHSIQADHLIIVF